MTPSASRRLDLKRPILVSKIVNLHPIIVVVSVILGSQTLGVVGMVVSIPLAAALMEHDTRHVGTMRRSRRVWPSDLILTRAEARRSSDGEVRVMYSQSVLGLCNFMD